MWLRATARRDALKFNRASRVVGDLRTGGTAPAGRARHEDTSSRGRGGALPEAWGSPSRRYRGSQASGGTWVCRKPPPRV